MGHFFMVLGAKKEKSPRPMRFGTRAKNSRGATQIRPPKRPSCLLFVREGIRTGLPAHSGAVVRGNAAAWVPLNLENPLCPALSPYCSPSAWFGCLLYPLLGIASTNGVDFFAVEGVFSIGFDTTPSVCYNTGKVKSCIGSVRRLAPPEQEGQLLWSPLRKGGGAHGRYMGGSLSDCRIAHTDRASGLCHSHPDTPDEKEVTAPTAGNLGRLLL